MITLKDIERTIEELSRIPTKEDREKAYKQAEELMQYWKDCIIDREIKMTKVADKIMNTPIKVGKGDKVYINNMQG